MALNPALLKMVSQATAKYKGGGGKTRKPKEGRNTYRIVAPTFEQAPWVGEMGKFWADLGVHWIKAELNGKPMAVVGDCDTVYQQPSVLNTAIEMAINSAMDEDSKKLFEEWKARKSVLINVVDRGDSDAEDVLELTPTTFGKVLDLYTLYADAGQDITDPTSGADIVITKTGKGLNTNYDVAIAPMSKPVSAEVVSRAKDLNEYIAQNYFRGEEQKALNIIAQTAGVAVPRLAAPGSAPAVAARTPTAALASPSAAVPDAKVETTAAPAGPTAEELAAAKRREEILARQKAAADELAALEADAAATKAAAAAPVTAAPAAGATSLPASEQDAILAELDNLV